MAEAASDPICEEQEELHAEDSKGLTAQWREEDEEEAAREQRQRDRERQLQDQDKDEENEGGPSLEQPGQQALSHQAKVQLEESDLRYRESNTEDAVESSGEAEKHLISHRARTPSPLASEDTLELSSPPLSPTTKLADRTESLNRSIKKSNSVKKSQPTLPISTIDERLQQYTQATESAGRTPKLSRQPSIELPSMAVASTKTRWETGEVQSASKTPSCQDIVAGDMSKKSLWEQKGGSKISSTIKSTPSGKRYKFVATGHGKYEKVLVDEGSAP
ncbi:lymphocyte-specific protein 1 isoform X2 [Apodemus sylvaticus]|uniref:lymphocyte-specific protein 1 isoform X2 n=1 Tax=Apodemus sylvaticus TaxID=10129 RepID=UPI002241945B|nr:lymphocyte-specific protein 1 isoform X2 [Apodemus sylvaticus]